MKRILLIVLFLIVSASCVQAAGTITLIGSCGTSGLTCNITATSGVAQGHGVIMVYWTSAGGDNNVITGSDSASNTYQTDDSFNSSSVGADGVIRSAFMTNAIATNGTITCTASIDNGRCVAFDASSFASSGWLDQKNHQAVTGNATPSTPSVTTLQATEFIFGFFVTPGAFSAYGSTYTGLDNRLDGRVGAEEYKEVTSTGSYSASITWTTAADSICFIATYKEAVAGAGAGSSVKKKKIIFY